MFVSALLLIILRFVLAAENKRRDRAQHDDTYDDVYLTHVKEDGTTEEKRVDRVCLSLTQIVAIEMALCCLLRHSLI